MQNKDHGLVNVLAADIERAHNRWRSFDPVPFSSFDPESFGPFKNGFLGLGRYTILYLGKEPIRHLPESAARKIAMLNSPHWHALLTAYYINQWSEEENEHDP